MAKFQFNIGTGVSARTLNFEGKSKQDAEEKAKDWQRNHPVYQGVSFVQKVAIRKPKINNKIKAL